MVDERKGFYGGRVEPDESGELVLTPVVHPEHVSRYPAAVYTNYPEADRQTGTPRAYPCLRVLDGSTVEIQQPICGRPSEFHAKDDTAKYGHVCRQCWEGFPEAERAEYAERQTLLLNAIYGKMATKQTFGGGK